MRGESWLALDTECAHLWDYYADWSAALTTTDTLFTFSARPHCDFFLPQINALVLNDDAVVASVVDGSWRHLLMNLQHKKKTLEQLRAECERVVPANTVLITDRARTLPTLNLPRGMIVLHIDSVAALHNSEPTWREIRLALNSKQFDTVLVNLGPARMMILPRLAQVFAVRALDVTPWSRPITPQASVLMRAYRRARRAFAKK